MIQNNLIWIQGRSTKEKRSFLVYDRKNDPTAAAALEIQGRPRGAQKFQSLSVGPLGQYLFASVEPFWSSGRANLSRSEKSIFEAKMAYLRYLSGLCAKRETHSAHLEDVCGPSVARKKKN